MNQTIGVILTIIGVVIVLSLLAFGTTYGQLKMKEYFGPKFKAIERDIWEETPSRVLGATQEIAKQQQAYNKATDDIEKQAICSYLRNSYPDLTPDKIKDYKLRTFFEKCKYGS